MISKATTSRRSIRAHRREGAAHARRHPGVQGAVGRRHQGERHARASRPRRRCWRRRSARPSSARSSAVSTTSGRNGMELIRDIVEIYDNYSFKTEVLVASCAASDPHHRSRADGRRHLHVSARGHRLALQPPADEHRVEEVPEGLGKVVRRESLILSLILIFRIPHPSDSGVRSPASRLRIRDCSMQDEDSGFELRDEDPGRGMG